MYDCYYRDCNYTVYNKACNLTSTIFCFRIFVFQFEFIIILIKSMFVIFVRHNYCIKRAPTDKTMLYWLDSNVNLHTINKIIIIQAYIFTFYVFNFNNCEYSSMILLIVINIHKRICFIIILTKVKKCIILNSTWQSQLGLMY